MRPNKIREQHIAVFGESGSGKTVLLSSFYGATQEPQDHRESLFRIVADDIGQGNLLRKNYLGMAKEAQVPDATKFKSTAYSFTVMLKDPPDMEPKKKQPFDALRLVWHDYPGEWFEDSVSGPTEAKNRADTFRSLLGSDVALLLVDAQRLLEYPGEEERYLKSLFGNFRDGLLSLKDDLLGDGKGLVDFPRVWVIALSKADLIPQMSVSDFKDLMILKAADEINDLNEVLSEFIQGSEALSVSEDFLLLSSAKFESNKIEVRKRVGLDMLLPLAAILPLERHVRWAKALNLPRKVVESLVGPSTKGLTALAFILLSRTKMPGPIGLVQTALVPFASKDVLDKAVKLAGEKLRATRAEAEARQDYLTATLADFKMDLERGEKEDVLLKGQR